MLNLQKNRKQRYIFYGIILLIGIITLFLGVKISVDKLNRTIINQNILVISKLMNKI